MDKFGRSELRFKMQNPTKRRLRRLEKKVDLFEQRNKEYLIRLVEQLFFWIYQAHTTKPKTMAIGEFTHTKDNYIDWSKVFESEHTG